MWLTALLPLIDKILGAVLPDPAAQADARLRLLQLEANGQLAALAAETELARGQQEINKVEAASSSLWVAGWRPFIGWICGFALAFKYIGGPGVQMVSRLYGHDVALPEIDAGELWPLLAAMLGVGLPSLAKLKGKA